MKKIILSLGGNINRLDTTLKLSKEHSDALIIVSSENDPKGCLDKFKAASIPKDRFIFDYQAWDTLTNFTTTRSFIEKNKVTDLYVVTDSFHMQRAKVICDIVYYNSDINRYYVFHEPDNRKEPTKLVWYDMFRAIIWKTTGILLYDKSVKDERMPQYEADSKYMEQLLKEY